MNIPEVQTPRYEQTKQFINFVEGKDNEEPDAAQFPVHVLTGDTFLYHINGGDAPNEADPFITDILVYPNAEYWTTLLNGTRQRPFFDLSISEYNTLRIPSAVSDYDLYVDSGTFYEGVTIAGDTTMEGNLQVDMELTVVGDFLPGGDIQFDSAEDKKITGAFIHNRVPTADITTDTTIANSHTGMSLQSKPATGNTNITLPSTGIATGTMVTVINCLVGKTTTFTGTLLARGPVLSEQYSAATVFYDGSDWYGLGDLV